MADKVTNIFVHSWHQKKPENRVGIKEKIVITHDDGTVDVQNHLRFFEDPRRPFWVTKREYRDHRYKKEYEEIDKCDMYLCHDSELGAKCEYALNGYIPKFNKPLGVICRSPYLYGADISTESMIKQKYLELQGDTVVPFTIGGFDIETEVDGNERIIAITFIHQKQIYTSCLKEYCKIYDGDNYVREANLDDLNNATHRLLDKILTKHGFNFQIHIADTELGVIKWVFDRIHECKTDFISIWNMGYDIPYVIRRLTALGVDPTEVMCPNDIPEDVKYVDWYEDNSKVAHFTDKWHWLSCSSYSQFIDSMCLYARLRKVYGRDSSYSLDAISEKELGLTKLHFGKITNHYKAQHREFPDYVAYNINDVILLILMEEKNSDITSMCALADSTVIREYSRQTAIVKNSAFIFAKQHGKVIATTSDNMYTQYDEMLGKAGGTVLPLDKAVGLSIPILKDSSTKSMFAVMINDLDISSSYPSVISSMNVSKEACLSTLVKINGFKQNDVEQYATAAVNPSIHANIAVPWFFDMPNYEEMLTKYQAHRASLGLRD